MTDNPYKIATPFCISFSGGRTSAFMLAKVIEAHGGTMPAGGHVVFANTGREHEGTLEFVRDCAKNFGVDIAWVEYDHAAKNRFRVVDFASASRDGRPFEELIKSKQALPNFMRRFCTETLKVRTIANYLNSIGVDEGTMIVGLRADEPRRVHRVQGDEREGFLYECPISKAGHVLADVHAFWATMPWDLKLPNNDRAFGNCDMCFLKGKRILERVVRAEPERAEWWSRMEKERGRTWVHGRPVEQLLVQVRIQPELFDKGDDDDETIIPCTCTD
jgi:3'-phosphoadenosine 5'-phosphosulfate sulfotransferase (PAPS reductase)/FAD synthetase